MPPPTSPPDPELTTWQEIAAYLGVSVRTAQLWRKHRGLPVRKLGGRVIGRTAELDRWLSGAGGSAPAPPASPNIRRRSGWIAAAISAVLLAGAAGLLQSIRPAGRLVRYEIRQNRLAVFDESERIAWTREFDYPLADRPNPEPWGPGYARSSFVSSDHEAQPELLFFAWRGPAFQGLYCFRDGPVPAWIAPAGRSIVDPAGVAIDDRYVPIHLVVLKKPRPDGARLILASRHVSRPIARLAAIDPRGRTVAEHWHPGWFYSMSAGDLDADGIEELILSGTNHTFSKDHASAILLVFDSSFTSGQGPFGLVDTMTVKDLSTGSQPVAALLFPEVPCPSGSWYPAARAQWVTDHLEVAVTGRDRDCRLHYQLNRNLGVESYISTAQVLSHIAPDFAPEQRREMLRRSASGVRAVVNRFEPTSTETGNAL